MNPRRITSFPGFQESQEPVNFTDMSLVQNIFDCRFKINKIVCGSFHESMIQNHFWIHIYHIWKISQGLFTSC